MAEKVGRRNFLKQVAVVGTAAVGGVPAVEATIEAAVPAAAPEAQTAQQPKSTVPARDGYTFLTVPEAAFVEAFVDVLVPADELTPSGTDLGLATFIDRQLAGAWGKGDRLYQQGPWAQGAPGQGYQLPLTPAEFFRAGIAEVNKHCKQEYGKEFDRLAPADKQRVLESLDKSMIKLDRLSGKQFFDAAYQATMEGLFGDPIYGGNKNKAAWKMIGYPGVIAVHATNITTYKNKAYVVPPVGIADLQ
jgi:gluconate 2-dehydrogenase gamma chain